MTEDGFGFNDANVACRQLGLEPGGVWLEQIASDGPIWMDALNCTGEESALRLCPQTSLGVDHTTRGKTHSKDVGL